MNTYRYILERYRGISTRYRCPQCGRKHTFTRYIDTENNNKYISDNVGKCNRLDKCGYYYTPREHFTNNPHKRDNFLVVDGSLRPFTDNPHKRDNARMCENNNFSFFQNIGKWKNEKWKKAPRPVPPKAYGRTTRGVGYRRAFA